MHKRHNAFTIVELLVVIVVIGVLASIISISYSGITQRANISTLKSDTYQAGSLLAMYQVDNNQYPDSIDLVNNGQGLPSSNGVTYSYTKISDSAFCLTVKHEDLANIGYFITQDNRTPTSGFCPGDAPPITMENSVVSTVAGSGVQGFSDGADSIAQFYLPRGLVVDDSGNIYISDALNHRVRKIDTNNTVSTIAGDGVAGTVDGASSIARFNQPTDIVIDTVGNIFTIDTAGNRIRKITPSGVVSTFAGSGVSGFADGAADVAKFNGPYDVTVDNSGNVYVADFYNQRIRKITPGGLVSTLAGHNYGSSGSADGLGSSALFYGPVRLATDFLNNIYVGDSYNNRIRKITPGGLVSTIAGSISSFADGPSVDAKFKIPWGLDLDKSGNIYIADQGNNRIRKISLQ